jgi:hypothetical protein
MAEESKKVPWIWIAFREFLYIAGIFLLILLFWFLNREAISKIIKDIQDLKLPQDYYIFAIVAVALYLMILAFRIIGWRNRAKSLPESWGGSGVIHIGYFKIKRENDSILFNKKGFIKSRSWKQRKSEFKGVRLLGEYRYDKEEGSSLIYTIDLLHKERSKTIILLEEWISTWQFISIRKIWKETARALGLPAIENSSLGSLFRGVQDIDKTIRHFAKENKISFDFKISNLPENTKVLQKDDELTIIFRKGPLSKIEIIISLKFMKIGRIIIPFDEMQHIESLHHTTLTKSYHTLIFASDSEAFSIDGLSSGQISWLERLILAGACGKPNILRIKYEPTIE